MGTAGFANPSFPTLWTPPFPTLGESLRRDIIAAAGLQGCRNPVSGAGRSSPLRRGVWVLCVRSCIVRVSVGLVWHISLVFHYWVEKRRCLFGFYARFLITADREIVPISSGASPFHQIGWAEPYWKKVFVRRKPLMPRFPIPLSAKTIDPTAVSANPTKDFGKNPM